MKIILGSRSKSRRRILENAGWEFEVMSAEIDEKAIRFDDPSELTLALARAKANALKDKINAPAILITADQVVVCDGRIREKPETESQAREYLRSYENFRAEAVNGIHVFNAQNGKSAELIEISKIKFKKIPEEVIDQLISEGNVFHQAGAFSAEDPLINPYIDYIEGTMDGIEGLPLEIVKKLIAQVT